MADVSDLTEIFQQLTAEEQAILRPVLERDLEFQRREKQRVRNLRTSIDLSKSESTSNRSSAYSMQTSESQESMASYNSNISNSVSPTSPSFRCCARCSSKLGFILNSGAKCRKCSLLVCEACRVFTTEAKKVWMCPICFKERELQAASGGWVECDEDISKNLLVQLKRVSKSRPPTKTGSFQAPHARAPPISRRNMTLPSLGNMTLLSVPSESEAVGTNRDAVTRRFWGGSPSPRSPSPRPVSASSDIVITCATPTNNQRGRLVPELHPREVIGSPAPRSAPPVPFTKNMLPSPCLQDQKANTIKLPTTQVAPPTPTTGAPPSPTAETRRQGFSSKRPERSYLLSPANLQENNRRQSYSPDNNWNEHTAGKRGIITTKTPFAVSDPQLSTVRPSSCYDDWEPMRRKNGSEDNNNSNSFKESASTGHLDVPNNERRRMSSTSSKSESHRGRMKRSASRDTDTISIASSMTEDQTTHSNVGSQIFNPPRFIGEIQVKISYDVHTESLLVQIIQCRSLPHFGKHKPNPYVKVSLFGFSSPNSANPVLCQKTTARRSSVDPAFSEILKFAQIRKSSLDQQKLLISVWHKDTIAQNSLIGEVILPLSDCSWSSDQPFWLLLEGRAVGGRGSSTVVPKRNNLHATAVQCTRQREGNRQAEYIHRQNRMANCYRTTSMSGSNASGNNTLLQQSSPTHSEKQIKEAIREVRNAVGLESNAGRTKHQRSTSKKHGCDDSKTDWTLWI